MEIETSTLIFYLYPPGLRFIGEKKQETKMNIVKTHMTKHARLLSSIQTRHVLLTSTHALNKSNYIFSNELKKMVKSALVALIGAHYKSVL